MAFEDIVSKCIEDNSYLDYIMGHLDKFKLTLEELALLKETDFSAFGFQADERSALSTLSMWGATLA